jgi:hypothetical protein
VIDPATLQAQRRVFATVTRRGGGRAPLCLCGFCRTCCHRESMRKWRASLPKRPPKPNGPKMDMGRKCFCGEPIANKNTTGFCQYCHRKLKRPTEARARLAERGIAA